MKIVSVNVGTPREVLWNGTPVLTAIFKEPVEGPVRVRRLNMDGDRQADLTVHGGADKAVYGYAAEHYEYWRQQLPDVRFSLGRFGENLTTEGLLEEALCIGDRLKIGSAVLTVTQPRMPCYKLGLRFGRDDMIKRFLISRRSGPSTCPHCRRAGRAHCWSDRRRTGAEGHSAAHFLPPLLARC